MTTRSLLPVVALMLLGICCGLMLLGPTARAEDNDAIQKELEQMQGEWSMLSGSADGFEIPSAMIPSYKRVCKGDETTVTNGTQLVMKAKVTINPSKNPKTVDYDVVDGPTKGEKHLGIYELAGDTLKFCFGAPGMERPTEFTSKSGDLRAVSTWQRKKPQ